jgi:type I restriction enzyme, R subunit
VSQKEAEQRRGFDASSPKCYADTSPGTPLKDRANPSSSSDYAGARGGTLFFDDLLDAKVREFNPRYAEAEGVLPGKFRHLHTDIYGKREFVEHRDFFRILIHQLRNARIRAAEIFIR